MDHVVHFAILATSYGGHGVKPTQRLHHLSDNFLQGLKQQWFEQSHQFVGGHKFVPMAAEWFRGTRRNTLLGWDAFPCVDVILGCTHFIESLLIRHRGRIQVLPGDYAYYGLMGIHGTEAGQLEPGVPLLISLPNWRWADLRPEWPDVLRECEQKKIDIHIDMAWITVSRDIELDLDHPCIKSFGMSLSKYSMEWNRIGLRWSRQRTMDSVTIFNQYQGMPNANLTSCGAFVMKNLPRDYAWNTYQHAHEQVCQDHNLLPSRAIHVAHSPDRSQVWGIANLILGASTPDRIG